MEKTKNKTGGLKYKEINCKENSKMFADPEMTSSESVNRKELKTRAEKDQRIKKITANVNHRKNNVLLFASLA